MDTTRTVQARVLVAGVACLVAVLALAGGASAGLADRLEGGSILIEITGGNPAALVGLAVTMNPGLEKTVSYPLPRLAPSETRVTVPLFFMHLVTGDGNAPLIRAIDTLLVVSNGNAPGAGDLGLRITFQRADGSPAEGAGNPVSVVIVPGATAVVSAAATLDQ